MRSGRLDRKIEFPHPTEDARAKILRIHSRQMNVSPDVNFEELARSSDDFNAAQLKVCLRGALHAVLGPSTRRANPAHDGASIAGVAKARLRCIAFAMLCQGSVRDM